MWIIMFTNELFKKLSNRYFWQWRPQSLTHMVCMFGNGTLVDLLRFDKVVQARTKVPSKGPDRRAGDWNRRSGTSLRFNRCSTGAFARACALSFVGEISGYAVRKLETLKHIFDRRAAGARNSEHLYAHKIIRPAFRLALQGFTSEGFHSENLQSNLPSHPKRI